jgi:hypothetical protein
MSASRRRALGLLSVVLGACATGDNEMGSSSGQGFPGDGGGTSEETSTSANGSDTGTDNGTDTGADDGTDTGTDSYGTDGMADGSGDGGYFEGEQSAEDVDLDR